jgi:single-stranded DNA-binding protein
MKMLGGKGDGQQNDAPRQSAPAPSTPAPKKQASGGGFGDFDDDIPFQQLGSGASWRVI